MLYSNQFIDCRTIEKINDILRIQLKVADFAGLMQITKIILRIVGLYGKSFYYANGNLKHTLWMRDQFDHAVFLRSHLTEECSKC